MTLQTSNRSQLRSPASGEPLPKQLPRQLTRSKTLRVKEVGDGEEGLDSYDLARHQGSKVDMFKKMKSEEASLAKSEEPTTQCGMVRSWCSRIVKSTVCEIFFALMIVTNSAYLGVQLEWSSQNRDRTAEQQNVFLVINVVYAVIFLIEVCLRLLASGPRIYFLAPGWSWNWLDVFVVTSTWVELAVGFVSVDGNDGGLSNSNLRLLRVIKVTRLARVLRVLRVVQFVRPLRTLMHCLVDTTKSFVWSLMLLVLMMYVFGLLFTDAAIDHMRIIGTTDPDMDRLFGTVLEWFRRFPDSWERGFDRFRSHKKAAEWAAKQGVEAPPTEKEWMAARLKHRGVDLHPSEWLGAWFFWPGLNIAWLFWMEPALVNEHGEYEVGLTRDNEMQCYMSVDPKTTVQELLKQGLARTCDGSVYRAIALTIHMETRAEHETDGLVPDDGEEKNDGGKKDDDEDASEKDDDKTKAKRARGAECRPGTGKFMNEELLREICFQLGSRSAAKTILKVFGVATPDSPAIDFRLPLVPWPFLSEVGLQHLAAEKTRSFFISIDETCFHATWSLVAGLVPGQQEVVIGGYHNDDESFAWLPDAGSLPRSTLARMSLHYVLSRSDTFQQTFDMNRIPMQPQASDKPKKQLEILGMLFSAFTDANDGRPPLGASYDGGGCNLLTSHQTFLAMRPASELTEVAFSSDCKVLREAGVRFFPYGILTFASLFMGSLLTLVTLGGDRLSPESRMYHGLLGYYLLLLNLRSAKLLHGKAWQTILFPSPRCTGHPELAAEDSLREAKQLLQNLAVDLDISEEQEHKQWLRQKAEEASEHFRGIFNKVPAHVVQEGMQHIRRETPMVAGRAPGDRTPGGTPPSGVNGKGQYHGGSRHPTPRDQPWEARLWTSLLEALEEAVSQTAHMLGDARGPPPPQQGGAYMDDTYLWSHDAKHLQATLNALEKQLAKHGLVINPKKTAIIYSNNDSGGGRFMVGGKQVPCLPFGSIVLGSPLTFGEAVPALVAEMQRRGRTAFRQHKDILGARTNIRGRLKAYNALVRNSALWGCEAWPVHDTLLKQANLLQMDHLRQMLHINRRPGECWADWHKRSLRQARVQLHKQQHTRWSSYTLERKQTAAMNKAAKTVDSEAAPPTGEDKPGDQVPDATRKGGSAGTLQEGTATGGEPSPSRAVAEANSTNAAGEDAAISASAGEDSSTSSSPPEDNPIRGTSSQKQIVRRMVRGIYERPWHADDLLWNLSQNRLTSMATARVGDKLRALGGQKREDIADALFNNAYSALMTVGTLSGGTHLQMAYDQLREDPLLAFEMWAACKVRWQEKLGIPAATVAKILASKPAISLPGGTDEGTEQKATEVQAETQIAVKEEIDWDASPEGTRQPVTPELLVDLDDGLGDQQPSADDIVEGVKHTWLSAATFATIFHNMTVADIRKEWGMPASPSTSEASSHEKKEQGESSGSAPGASAGGEPPLDQDELVKQVMDELKQSGGAPVQPSGGVQADREEELIDIEIDSGAATIRPASHLAKKAGEQLGDLGGEDEE
ncbi:CACNA1H, partial [Symbiodinium necroappetens]